MKFPYFHDTSNFTALFLNPLQTNYLAVVQGPSPTGHGASAMNLCYHKTPGGAPIDSWRKGAHLWVLTYGQLGNNASPNLEGRILFWLPPIVEYFIPLPLVDISWLRPSRASKFRVIAGPWKIRAQEVKVICANTSQQRCEDHRRRSGRNMATDALLSSHYRLGGRFMGNTRRLGTFTDVSAMIALGLLVGPVTNPRH